MELCCGQKPRQLPWTQCTPADYTGVRQNAMRKNTRGAMISFAIALGKMACTKLEMSRVYECPACKRRWRTWFEKNG